jgi:hypothetical protein
MTTGEGAVLIGGCVVIPGGLLAELRAELEQPRQTVPMGVIQPHRSRQMAALVDMLMSGAIAHRQATCETPRAFVPLSHPASVPPWEASVVAGDLSEDGRVAGVAVVSEMLGFSPQWVRVLAASGALPGACKTRGSVGNGRGTARNRWCIPLASVHAYLRDRQVT